jgi:hypothetical protein
MEKLQQYLFKKMIPYSISDTPFGMTLELDLDFVGLVKISYIEKKTFDEIIKEINNKHLDQLKLQHRIIQSHANRIKYEIENYKPIL